MNRKQLLTFLLSTTLLSTSLIASPKLEVYVNNQFSPEASSMSLLHNNETTMIPIRCVSEMLDIKVDWISPNVILSKTDSTSENIQKILINTSTQTITTNNIPCNNIIILKNDTTLVPLRFFSETFGYNVHWSNQTITITEPIISTAHINSSENKILTLVNVAREKINLHPLILDEELNQVATLKSADMSINNYFDHTSPTYGSPFDMMRKFNIKFGYAGENIAYGYPTPEQVVDGWMNSEGHRANILNSNFKKMGIGYNNSGHYWTQVFTD